MCHKNYMYLVFFSSRFWGFYFCGVKNYRGEL